MVVRIEARVLPRVWKQQGYGKESVMRQWMRKQERGGSQMRGRNEAGRLKTERKTAMERRKVRV